MAITEARISAIENDLAQLIEKVELNMVTKTDWRAYNLTMEMAIQDLQNAITSGDITDVDDIYNQLQTLRDAYLAHTDHPPPGL